MTGILFEASPEHYSWLLETLRGLHNVCSVPILATVSPVNARALLRRPEASAVLCGNSIQSTKLADVDIVVVDIDSWDCEVLLEVLREVRSKFIFLELNSLVPPPF